MLLIKIGGGATINLPGIIADLAPIQEPTILVHGANALRDEVAKKLGSSVRTITSLSGVTSVYSDDAAIDLLMMTYAGLRNRRIVEMCQRSGVNAVGLCGLDGRVVQGERNAAVRVREGGKTMIVRDNSGKPRLVNTRLLSLLLDQGFVPVLTVPIADAEGRAINSDNDDIVAALHEALSAKTVIQFIEAPGLLQDKDDPTSVINSLPAAELSTWEDRVEGRMRRKIMGLRRLFEGGAARVIIADGRREHPLHDAFAGIGTVIE